MCISHLVLTLTKWLEFYDRFRRVIPSDCLVACRSLRNDLRARGVTDFRNKCVGHIWDKALDRPLTDREVDAYLDRITRGEFSAFLKWLNDPARNTFPSTVVSVVEQTRNRIMEEFHISESALGYR
jgi:hypothetical protein